MCVWNIKKSKQFLRYRTGTEPISRHLLKSIMAAKSNVKNKVKIITLKTSTSTKVGVCAIWKKSSQWFPRYCPENMDERPDRHATDNILGTSPYFVGSKLTGYPVKNYCLLAFMAGSNGILQHWWYRSLATAFWICKSTCRAKRQYLLTR